EDAPAVNTVFVLVGTKDERNFHLRALAAIAQIVQNPHFKDRWLAAKSEESLRDIVLLGKRSR
ncbi:PTS sugar transporter subunit IIA, partial [candidate division WOR-3 bacterium]|nr:PTS sugar transporter subunit IIA [candidate division WOR-3 bacterium]